MHKEWFSQARLYHIFIDRFAGCKDVDPNSPVFAGGSLLDIIPHLDHISSLGATAIWLSPFYKGVAYHGYHITDFMSVDEHFGTINDLQKLINEAHQRNLRVIADFVPNHCSQHHPFFIDACKNPKSQYRSWFYFDEYPNKYWSFLDFTELPKINLRNPNAAKHLLNSAQFWLNMGIDGFRIDHVLGVPRSFLKQLKRQTAAQNPDAILFGEVWTEGLQPHHFKLIDIKYRWWHKRFGISQHTAQCNYIGILDGVLDFESRAILLQEVAHANTISFDNIEQQLKKHRSRYPASFRLVQFLDNHDTNRFLFESNNEILKLLTALRLIANSEQPMVLYNGTEAGETQSQALSFARPHADLAVRQPMPWNNLDQILCSEIATILKK